MRTQSPASYLVVALLALLCVGTGPIHAHEAFARSGPTGMEAAGGDGDADDNGDGGASANRELRGNFEPPEYKSKAVAHLSSVLATAAPILLAAQLSSSTHGGSEGWVGGLAIGGLLLGPSAGQIYAGSQSGAWLGVGIRAGGMLLTWLGVGQFAGSLFCSSEEEEDCDPPPTAIPLLVAGIDIFIGGTVYSVINAGRTVDRVNESRSRVFGWAPTFSPAPQGGMRAGAIAYMRF
jgi:hypothetical protein